MNDDKRKEEEPAKLNQGMEDAFDEFLGLDRITKADGLRNRRPAR